MKTEFIICITVFLFAIGLLLGCSEDEAGQNKTHRDHLELVMGEKDELCLFFPVIKTGEFNPNYQIREPRLSRIDLIKLQKTMDIYSIRFQIEGSNLFVPCEIMGDIEYIYNLTQKSKL